MIVHLISDDFFIEISVVSNSKVIYPHLGQQQIHRLEGGYHQLEHLDGLGSLHTPAVGVSQLFHQFRDNLKRHSL